MTKLPTRLAVSDRPSSHATEIAAERPGGQCLMFQGSSPFVPLDAKQAFAAEVARRWNAYEGLLKVCQLVLTVATPDGAGGLRFDAAWAEDVRAAVKQAKGEG